MKYGYIYIIKNNVNQKCYIGQTKYSIDKRWREHISNVQIRNQLIYLAVRKCGVENFYVEELEKTTLDKLDIRERYWISKLNTISPNGYNMTPGGDFNPMHVPEIAKKVS